MRMDDTPESRNVDDRRGRRQARGGFGLPRMGGGRGISGIGLVVLVVGALIFGIDPIALLSGLWDPEGQFAPDTRQQPVPPGPVGGVDDEMRQFIGRVLGSTEEAWAEVFASQVGRPYQEPTLVLFTGAVRSACGSASSAVGPFYCPEDRKVYIDLSFYDELRDRFRAPGDFAQAYVVAHEVGHHVQRLLGITDRVQQARRGMSEAAGNELSVRLELQADCFAGIWAYHAHRKRQILEPGDIEEGLGAASAIGDDRLQRRSGGHVMPDTFTHGTSAQRVAWLRRGIEGGGDIRVCDTFSAGRL